MITNELWNVFYKTGKVSDYLAFSKARDLLKEREEADEVHDRRTDNKDLQRR